MKNLKKKCKAGDLVSYTLEHHHRNDGIRKKSAQRKTLRALCFMVGCQGLKPGTY